VAGIQNVAAITETAGTNRSGGSLIVIPSGAPVALRSE
jgi:hypothetical protein